MVLLIATQGSHVELENTVNENVQPDSSITDDNEDSLNTTINNQNN